MITALTVNLPEKRKGILGIADKIRRDKVDIKLKKARGVSLKHITYTSYSGKIKLQYIDHLIGVQRNRLVCVENLAFPQNSGYRRFSAPDFSCRLCTNMALSALKDCEQSENLCVGIYDPEGYSADVIFEVLKYCSDVRIITDNSELYRPELERAMEEFGATAILTENRSEIDNCNFIIAPTQICEVLPIKIDSVVLTVGCPKEKVSGLVYHKYYLRVPKGFDLLKPAELDDEYFCSALYSLAAQYELGSVVPTLCSSYSSSQTLKSLCAYLSNLSANKA